MNDGKIKIEVNEKDGKIFTSIDSVRTYSKELNNEYIKKVLDAFNLKYNDLNKNYPIKVAFSGNNHLIIFVNNKQKLKDMNYDFQKAKKLMTQEEIVTISILYAEDNNIFHSRNAFAYGGVYEDPATGSAAIALGEYLRNTGIKIQGQIEILQGFDMKQPSQLFVSYKNEANSSIKVFGQSRMIK